MEISSSVLQKKKPIGEDQVFNGFGCSGKNISPDLKWSGAPKDTKAFAVTVYDPDAPTGSGWWHWVVFNIPADVMQLNAGITEANLPAGAVQSRTDFGAPGYGGPCPPQGSKPHRYIFKVFALKDKLPLDKEASAAQVGFYANQMKLAEGTLEAVYSRK
jgi:Raf kinase inhibitor-like YbhB/YbcL family protein